MYSILRKSVLFSRRQKRLLHKQTISTEGPGSILHDFEALLTYVEDRRMRVTGMHQLPLRSLPEINARLGDPLRLGLERPVQKSYPPIHGLYLLLRASGLTYLDYTSAEPVLVIDESLRRRWDTLNATERYCTLLETWLLRGWPEILGERSNLYLSRPENLEDWFYFHTRLPDDGLNPTEEGNEVCLMYSPGWQNLGLLHLFGFIEIRSGPPVEGQGWQIERIYRTSFGSALLALLTAQFFGDHDHIEALRETERAPSGMLQPVLQPYFPAWQRTLPSPQKDAYRAGTHVFKVTLWRGLWRRLAIPGNTTLDALAAAILDAFDFRLDHLYRFSYETRFGTQQEIDHPDLQVSDGPYTSEVRVGSLPLLMGQTMTFLFDFGDHWEFQLTLERVDSTDSALQQCELLESHGGAPPQYRQWENWDEF